MKIGTLTTGVGVVTTIKLNYLPQYLYYIAATQLTGLVVTVAGDGVIVNLDAVGLAAISGIRRYGAVANSYMIPLADGFVPNKVVEMVFTNSAAQTPDIFGFSLVKGDGYAVSFMETVLASSGKIFENFAHLAVLSMAATDLLTINYEDGHVQDFNSVELLGLYTLYSNETDSYCIDNLDFAIVSVKLVPAADRKVLVTRFIPVGTFD
jgi:hypothetical protein